jgi:hypothetical protein
MGLACCTSLWLWLPEVRLGEECGDELERQTEDHL